MVGGTKFYDRKEIKDVIAYLRVLYNPEDSLSLVRILNVPKRSIGATSIEHLTDYAEENGISLFDALSTTDELPVTKRVKTALCGSDFFSSRRSEQDRRAYSYRKSG